MYIFTVRALVARLRCRQPTCVTVRRSNLRLLLPCSRFVLFAHNPSSLSRQVAVPGTAFTSPSPMSSENPVMDTPTRASRAMRPQTRAWKQLISDATNRTTATASQRARLRAHLAAADRLAAKRRALRLATNDDNVVANEQATQKLVKSSDMKKKPGMVMEKNAATEAVTKDSVVVVDPKQIAKKLKLDDTTTTTDTVINKGADGNKPPIAPRKLTADSHSADNEKAIEDTVTGMFASKAIWTEQVNALNSYARNPCVEKTPALAAVLPRVLCDLRGQIVVAGADATVSAAPYLNRKEHNDLLLIVLDASFRGAAVTKRVMADPCERATLALLRECVHTDVWQRVIYKLQKDDHTATRCLVIKAVTQLVKEGSPTRVDFISNIAMDCVRAAALDKMVQVRDVARGLLVEFRSRFGEERADKLLLQSIPNADMRTRFVKPADKNNILANRSTGHQQQKVTAGGGVKRVKPPSSNIRELIKARRAAAAKAAAAAKSNSGIETSDAVGVSDGAEIVESGTKTSVPTTIR